VAVSPNNDVQKFYDDSADEYAEIMDTDIESPVYQDLLRRLAERLVGHPGAIVDTSCGPGHVLHRYHERFDPPRPLIGVDLSDRMARLAQARLGAAAVVRTDDMRTLITVGDATAAAVLSLFALHHVDAGDASQALTTWRRVLAPAGQLIVAAWEGRGTIDYGSFSDLKALRYSQQEIGDLVTASGFSIDRSEVTPVEGMEMDAVWLEATRSG